MKRRALVLASLFGAVVCLLWWLNPRDLAPEARPDKGTQEAKEPLPKQALNVQHQPIISFAPTGLGRDRPSEGNPEGPMALAADRQGQLVVLDQVNQRIVRAGKPALPVPVRAAQDILVTSNGDIAVLDRLVDKRVVLLRDDGSKLAELAVEGRGIKEGGSVTGLVEDRGMIYAEREHGMWVQLGSIEGTASSTREEMRGRPSRDGKLLLTAGMSGSTAVYLSAIDRSTGAHAYTRKIDAGERIEAIEHLDSAASGVVHLVVKLAHQNLLFCLAGNDGHTLSQQSLPISHEPEETFRTFATRDDGALLQALLREETVDYLLHTCRSAEP